MCCQYQYQNIQYIDVAQIQMNKFNFKENLVHSKESRQPTVLGIDNCIDHCSGQPVNYIYGQEIFYISNIFIDIKVVFIARTFEI